ncbi:MAG: hypothetical protein KDH20_22630 [Rhodocyclaceae bacterium]|nr:hypothetical protein [Rhodocyclaceae bacterium]
MNYQCCACRHEFPYSNAVDGFRQGFREGFLCPACGAQLEAPLGNAKALPGKGGEVRMVLAAGLVITLWTAKLDASVTLGQLTIPFWTLPAALCLAAALWFAITRPRELVEPTLETRLIGPGLATTPINRNATASAPPPAATERIPGDKAQPSMRLDRVVLLGIGTLFGIFAARDWFWVGEFSAIFWVCGVAAALPIGLALFGSDALIRRACRRR